MNRRDFIRSGAIFGAAVAIAPAVSLEIPRKTYSFSDVKGVVENGGSFSFGHEPDCPGFEAIRADLVVGWKKAFGQDADPQPWTADGQLISILASNICDMGCTMSRAYRSFSPHAATGEQLDKLVQMNGHQRRFIGGRQPQYSPFGVGREVPNETDEELRERMRKRS